MKHVKQHILKKKKKKTGLQKLAVFCFFLLLILCLHLLVFIAKHHPGDANTNAEGRQQQHADLRSFVQVWQVVFWNPTVIKMVHVITCIIHK